MLTALIVVNLFKSEQFARVAGTGTIVGIIVDKQGAPLDAEIYILRTNIQGYADSTGAFEIRGVPAGARSLVIARQGGGIEIPVQVTASGTTHLGFIPFSGTRVPGQ